MPPSRSPKQRPRLILVLALGLAGGMALDRDTVTALLPWATFRSKASSEIELMAEAWGVIQKVYVDQTAVKPCALAYGAIGGMVDALGDTGHSRFLTPEMVREERDFFRGELKGIGAEVRMKEGHVVIVAPMDHSPAQRAGLRPSDIILKVDGKDVTGLPLEQVVSRITGPAGTRVRLTILTPATGRTSEVTVERASITLRSVTWQRLPGKRIAHLRIAAFNGGVAKDLRTALAAIKQQGLRAIVLDLRNNAGGLLKEAELSASQFLTEGNVLLEKDAEGRITPVAVDRGSEAVGVPTDMPIVVLINNGTASAAEIVAGALQDAHRAMLIGEKTFGTGTVLAEFPLSDGSALLLAVEEWLTPAGHVIWHKGINPDLAVSLAPEAAPLLPASERGMTEAELRASQDAQLLRAVALLQERGQRD